MKMKHNTYAGYQIIELYFFTFYFFVVFHELRDVSPLVLKRMTSRIISAERGSTRDVIQ